MNKFDLERELTACGVKPQAYAIDKGYKEEAYILENDGMFWNVYYFERGLHNDPRQFSSEEEACRYFFDLVTSDPTTKR